MEVILSHICINFSWPYFTFGQLVTLTFHIKWPHMTSYQLNKRFWAIFEPTLTWPNFSFGKLLTEWAHIMTTYDFLWAKRAIWAMFEPTSTWPNLDFLQLFMWIGANRDQIWFKRGWKSDFEKCSNRLQLDFNCCQLVRWIGEMVARYDFLEATRVILSNVRTVWAMFCDVLPLIMAIVFGL